MKTSLDFVVAFLSPGLGIKRWLILFALGVCIVGVCVVEAVFVYFNFELDLFSTAELDIPVWIRVFVGLVIGMVFVVFAAIQISQEFVYTISPSGKSVISLVAGRRRKSKGPKVVVIGGGTGMFSLLRGLKDHTSNVSAIVTVADDGGSSGRLRRDLGVLPPGDLRNCLVALADDEALLTQLFKYRFGITGGVDGHSFGNLFITAMTEITGSFERALAVSGQVLAITGQVLPSTLENVTLMADIREYHGASPHRVSGESAIPAETGIIDRVYLDPSDVPANPEAVKAILGADVIVLGPGSLFTSVLPNLLVSDISSAIRNSRGVTICVTNVATQSGETDGFSVEMHADTIIDHVGNLFSVVLANDKYVGNLMANMEWVKDCRGVSHIYEIKSCDLLDLDYPWRHDANKLAGAILKIVNNN